MKKNNLSIFFNLINGSFLTLDRISGGISSLLIFFFSLIEIIKENNSKIKLSFFFLIFFLFLQFFFSLIGIYPSFDSVYYSNYLIIRQFIIYIIFVTLIFSYSSYFKINNFNFLEITKKKIIISYLIIVLIFNLNFLINPSINIFFNEIKFLYGLNNKGLIIFSLISILLLKLKRFEISFILCCLGIYYTNSLQTSIALVIIIIILHSKNVYKFLPIFIYVSINLITFIIVPLINYDLLTSLTYDSNIFVRWIIWNEGINNIFDNYLIFGVGYGSEWISNYYPQFLINDYLRDPIYHNDAELVAHHNSLISIWYRLGILPFIFFQFFLILLIKKAKNDKIKNIFLSLILVSIFSNPALESTTYSLIISLMSGYIIGHKEINY